MKASSETDLSPHTPLTAAIDAGQIGFLGVEDDLLRIRPGQMAQLGEPCLATVIANFGPGRFCAARPLRAWARVAVIHAKSEQVSDYQAVVGAVFAFQRLLLIETMPSIATAWYSFLSARIPTTGWVAGRPLL